MLAPRPDTLLQKGDRLMLLTTAATLVGLQQHFDKW